MCPVSGPLVILCIIGFWLKPLLISGITTIVAGYMWLKRKIKK